MTRTLAALVIATAALAVVATSALAASPATPYDATRISSFDPQQNGRFADRMASAGDLDRDGVGDVWIAAYSHPVSGVAFVGRIWAMSGRTRGVLYAIEHPEPQACTGVMGVNVPPTFSCGLGWNISNLGDVDGDGVNDLAAAATRQNVAGNANQGKAYVFSGAPGKPKTPLYDLDNPAPQANGYFGWASNAGDVVRADGSAGHDGIADIIVGAFQNDVPAGCGEQTPIPAGCRKDQGQSFIFNGAPDLAPGTPRLVRTLDIPAADRYLNPATGTCVSPNQQITMQNCGGAGIVNEGVGDVNRDGFWDQSVTAWTTGISRSTGEPCWGAPTVAAPGGDPADDCNERQGRIYLYSGRDGSVLRRIDNPVPQQGALFGLQIVQPGAPGDLDGDGYDDVYAIGFQQSGPSRDGQPPLPQEGRAWVFSGQAVASGPVGSSLSTPMLSLLDPTPEANGTFGYTLEQTDFNRDGRSDMYIGSFAGSYVFLHDGTLQKVFDLPAEERDPAQPPGNTNLGRSVAAPGDLNGDCEPDYLAGSPGSWVDGVSNVGRAYAYQSRGGPACPIAAPPPPPAPPVQPPAGEKLPAKLSLARATINRRDRVLDVLAPITRLASGRVNVELHAAGRRYRFTAAINSRDGRIRFRKRIPAAQARLGTGILTIRYRGDADTRPQTVRLRAANRQAQLRLARPRIANGRLRASGTVSDRARGVVRVQIQYVTAGTAHTREFKARIDDGRWSLNEQLSATVRTAIAQRIGTVHSYTLFTGYLPARMRGEMRSFQVLGPR